MSSIAAPCTYGTSTIFFMHCNIRGPPVNRRNDQHCPQHLIHGGNVLWKSFDMVTFGFFFFSAVFWGRPTWYDTDHPGWPPPSYWRRGLYSADILWQHDNLLQGILARLIYAGLSMDLCKFLMLNMNAFLRLNPHKPSLLIESRSCKKYSCPGFGLPPPPMHRTEPTQP